MKKFLMTIAAAFVAVSMSAQVYVGGEIGIASEKFGGGDAETTYKFIPEIGYSLNDEWAVGVKIGYQKGKADLTNSEAYDGISPREQFVISPYARYTFFKSNLVSAFVDGGLDIASIKDGDTVFNIGLRPGVAVNLTKELSFVTHVGFVGYKSYTSDNTKIGVDLNGNNVTFGLYYNF